MYRFLILIVTFWGLPAFSLEPLSKGYYQLEDSRVPEAIRATAESIFQVYVLSPQSKTTFDLAELDRQNNSLESKVKNLNASPEVKQIAMTQVQYCRAQKINSCDIYMPIGAGTAFLLGDGQTLWTDYHVIQTYVKDLASHFQREEWIAFLTLKNQNIPLFIFNKDHQLVFSGSKADGRATVLEKPFDGNHLNYLKGHYRPSSDFVKISLSRVIGKPLLLAKKAPAANEIVFTVGFPTGTGPYKTDEDPDHVSQLVSRRPFPDSTGDRMLVSVGVCLDDFEGFNRSFRSGQPPVERSDYYAVKARSQFGIEEIDLTRLIYAQIDAIFGNSGGPLMNEQGQVVGMAGSVNVESKDGQYLRSTLISLDMIKAVQGPPFGKLP